MNFVVEDAISPATYNEIIKMENATIYHTPNWHRFLRRTFSWQVRALLIYGKDGNPIWCLPFVSKRRFSGPINVCLPLSHRVGPVWQKDNNPVAPRFTRSAWPIEIHDLVPDLHHLTEHYVTEINLRRYSNIGELFGSFHKTSIQQNIKRAEKNGVHVVKCEEAGSFDVFYALQVATRHRQGSPVYPKNFFRNLWTELGAEGLARLYLAFVDDSPVSGIIFLVFGDTAIYGYGASVNDRSVWRLGTNQIAMWSAIRDAYVAGVARVDLGSTPASQPDLRLYKERWGGDSAPLYYSFGSDSTQPFRMRRHGAAFNGCSWLLKSMPERMFAAMSPAILRLVV